MSNQLISNWLLLIINEQLMTNQRKKFHCSLISLITQPAHWLGNVIIDYSLTNHFQESHSGTVIQHNYGHGSYQLQFSTLLFQYFSEISFSWNWRFFVTNGISVLLNPCYTISTGRLMMDDIIFVGFWASVHLRA